VTPEPQIVALGGISRDEPGALIDYLVGLTGRERPRACFVPTANAEEPNYVVWFYEHFGPRAETTHLSFFPWPPADLREFVLTNELIFVGGGNTANMLAIWRLHGLDTILREAWEAGTVLCGVSAGAICWFDATVTDSFGPQLERMDCLGFLPGSACPHYDGEELRRPRYRELVANGLPGGLALDDGVAARFVGIELEEVVTARPEGRAYRVELIDGEVRETPLEARLLS
jgi:dipeptidase E